MAVSITICNLALGDLRAPDIADINEGSVEAKACARYYPHCVDTLLDRHTWSFTTKLAPLAKLATNDRSLEWSYAYAQPSGILRAMRILPIATDGYVPYPTWLGAQDCWNRFEIQDGKLYTNLDSAQLEYAAADIDPSVMPPLFRDAVRKLLASSLAVPLRDSREMKADLLREAEIAIGRAIADDMNRQPNGEHVDDVARARMGL